ncbi:MAG: putative ABC transporter permease [Lachnospiraceae bacterium]|nr:putative ABC transporter permease [Lachnospiraceae bacterium]
MSLDTSVNLRAKWYTTAQYFLLFMVISFLGWALETVGCSIYEGGFSDRGFLTLPFCTIYGFTVLSVYGLIGTPDEGGILLKNVKCRPARKVTYFLVAALFTVSVELAVGWFFTRIFGISLWDYSAYRFNYKGYICLEFAILWGILFLLGMKYVFGPMKRSIERLSERWVFWTSLILAVLLATDWAELYVKLLLGS